MMPKIIFFNLFLFMQYAVQANTYYDIYAKMTSAHYDLNNINIRVEVSIEDSIHHELNKVISTTSLYKINNNIYDSTANGILISFGDTLYLEIDCEEKNIYISKNIDTKYSKETIMNMVYNEYHPSNTTPLYEKGYTLNVYEEDSFYVLEKTNVYSQFDYQKIYVNKQTSLIDKILHKSNKSKELNYNVTEKYSYFNYALDVQNCFDVNRYLPNDIHNKVTQNEFKDYNIINE